MEPSKQAKAKPKIKQRVNYIKLIYVMSNRVIKGELDLRAESLVYTTIFALVPTLAFTFAILKGFGFHNQIEPLLINFLTPMGEKGVELSQQIIAFVDQIKIGVLGFLGFLFLFYAIVSLIHKIENAFNYIWHTKHSKNYIQRLGGYFSVFFMGPLLFVLALGIMATMRSQSVVSHLLSIEPFGTVYYYVGLLTPILLIITGLTFVYILIPNTKVKISSALLGGVVAGLLWKILGWIFASFIAVSSNYAAIYSGFSIVMVFLIWLYLCWLTFLIGAQLAYYHQHPEWMLLKKESESEGQAHEILGLEIMRVIAYDFYHNKSPSSLNSLIAQTKAQPNHILSLLDKFAAVGLLVEVTEACNGYVLIKDPAMIQLADVMDTIRNEAVIKQLSEGSLKTVLQKIKTCRDHELQDMTLKDIC